MLVGFYIQHFDQYLIQPVLDTLFQLKFTLQLPSMQHMSYFMCSGNIDLCDIFALINSLY